MKLVTAVFVVLISLLLAPNFLPELPAVTEISELSKPIQEWFARGNMTTIHGRKMFYIYEKCRNPAIKNPQTFAILHGFPSSSFEYNKVFDSLLQYANVVVHDQVGFGLSEKPTEGYTYSIAEAADNTLALWRQLAVGKSHVLAHDMGDTVLTEIIARRHRELLPSYFDDFFASVTFTNGGMKYSLINKRIGQIILSNRYMGTMLNNLAIKLRLQSAIFRKQLNTLWPQGCDTEQRDIDIDYIGELNALNGGNKMTPDTIYYLWDRQHFEFRWYEALEKIAIPTRFIWGNADAVAPVSIPQFFTGLVPQARFEFVENCGHFWMMEKPQIWVEKMIQCLD